MSVSTRSDHNDHTSQSGISQAKAQATIACRLCGESIVLESNFRPTPTQCPHCGLESVFDPQEEPLPVKGIRLRWSEVVEAQRRGTVSYSRRHAAHVPPTPVLPQARTNYLAWFAAITAALAGVVTLFGGWWHR